MESSMLSAMSDAVNGASICWIVDSVVVAVLVVIAWAVGTLSSIGTGRSAGKAHCSVVIKLFSWLFIWPCWYRVVHLAMLVSGCSSGDVGIGLFIWRSWYRVVHLAMLVSGCSSGDVGIGLCRSITRGWWRACIHKAGRLFCWSLK